MNQENAKALTNSFQQYHRKLIHELSEVIRNAPPFSSLEAQDTVEDGGDDREVQVNVLKKLADLNADNTSHEEIAAGGQWLLSTIVSSFPHITPHVPRDLFWYFGGDCLHYLGDEEIGYFQALDEAFHLAQENGEAVVEYEDIVKRVVGQNQNIH